MSIDLFDDLLKAVYSKKEDLLKAVYSKKEGA